MIDSQTEKEIQEVVGEPEWMKSEGEQLADKLPESPASVNVRVYIDGFAVMFTMRSTDVAPLIQEAVRLINTGKAEGWKPSWKEDSKPLVEVPAQEKREFVQKISEGQPTLAPETCPIHNEKLYEKEGRYGTYWTHGWKENGYWMNCNGKTVKQGKPVS